MAEQNLSFAKIVANPNAYSWSQAYSAGKLFAVLSLETKEEIQEKDYLNVLGKEIFDSLEQEFFTLETKDLDSIKQAVVETSKKIPAEIECSFVICSILNNILYIYIVGNGKVALRREEKLGNLLEATDQKPDSLKTASGFLQNDDVIILQTKQFSNVISVETLSEFLDNLPPKDAAENIAPLVHEKDEAGAASIIISYKAPPIKEEEEFAPVLGPEVEISIQEETIQEVIPEEKEESPFYSGMDGRKTDFMRNIRPLFSSVFSRVKIPGKVNISHPRKVILTIIAVILIVFVGSIIFAVKKQQDTKTQTLFNSIYPEASKKYDEGQGLLELNQTLANEDFAQAKTILENGKDKLPKDSKEEKQILDLLAKVNSSLGPSQTTSVSSAQAKQVDSSVSSLLNIESKNAGLYYSQGDKNIFALTSDTVLSFNLDGTNKTTVIKNNSDWTSAGGLSNYFGNIYVLDKKQNQILKYAPTSSGFGKTNYFGSDTTPDFSKTVSMAIDSSVYVLSNDGTIAKFTRGKGDSFTLSGLDKSLLNPTAIFTTAGLNNIYVLDNGNSRIVVLDKSGKYQNQYQAGVIKIAKDLDVSEKDKKAYVLSSGKVYEIDLK
jgi:cell division protein FtsL